MELGREVNGLQLGQKITFHPQVVCGKCYPCRHGKYNLCEGLKVMGFQTTGAASEYFAVDFEKIVPLSENMSYDEGAMIEPLAVAVHAVRKTGNIQGKNVIVMGAGPIGSLVSQYAKGLGTARIMIRGVSDIRLEKAKECGADSALNVGRSDLGQEIEKLFGSDKADLIFGCAGNDQSIGQAVLCAGKGSVIVLVAVFSKLASLDLAVLNDHELTLDASMMYRKEDFLEAIRLVEQRKIKLKALISNHFPFREYQEAYRYIDEHKETAMKVIIDLD